MAKKIVRDSEPKKKLRPALTPQGRENQMINLAYDLVEERLRNGTATSQETTHFLKLGSEKEKLEREKLQKEIKQLEAKTSLIESNERNEQLFSEAIEAMKRYKGSSENPYD